MLKYKNISCSVKTFYGVTFEPNDVKEVPGYINSQGMLRIFNTKKLINNKRRAYNRKPVIVESKPTDSASSNALAKTNNTLKEETPNG